MKAYLDLVDEIIAENITITDPNLLEGVRNAVMQAIEETVEICIREIRLAIACREADSRLDGQIDLEGITEAIMEMLGLGGANNE